MKLPCFRLPIAMPTQLAAPLPIAVCAAALAVEQPAVDFNREIRPIFSAKCVRCHGKEEPQGGLSLLEHASAAGPLDSGLVGIVPGQPEASELVRRITSDDPDERMPQKLPALTAAEVDVIRRWIAQGADWPTPWAVRPLSKPAPPDLAQTLLAAWPKSDVDRFVGRCLWSVGSRLCPRPTHARSCGGCTSI